MAKGMATWADLLVRQGHVSQDELQEAEQMARAANQSLEDCLVRQVGIEEDLIMKAKAKQFGMKFVNLAELDVPGEVIRLIPEATARQQNCIAIQDTEDALVVATGDPMNFELSETLQFQMNRRVQLVLADPSVISSKIARFFDKEAESQSMDQVFNELTDSNMEGPGQAVFAEGEELVDEDSAPVVKLVQLLITEAVKARASDIHVEPFEDRVRVRYRIDGKLVERDSVPRGLLNAILSRIKILSKIDIAERRRPQDGRIKVTAGNKELDLRVSVLPSTHGQSVVMRLLDKDNIKVSLKDLGFNDDDFQAFNGLIRRPNGIILVTGPTGSGKTTTLYAALNSLNSPDRKIITAEDPVEYYLAGINQVEVRHGIGLNFARIIKSMLRQAPNVILVGEIRDRETAEMAIQASLTGHLVFSTLHTNDAPGAITRMVDVGVPPYLVASSVIAVMAQRLVRRVCSECKQPMQPSESVLQQAGIPLKVLERANFVKGKGCAKCNRSGYKGRQAIFELMQINSKIRELAFKGASTQEIRKAAIANGMKTLYRDGLVKAIKGITTLEEVFRVAKKQ